MRVHCDCPVHLQWDGAQPAILESLCMATVLCICGVTVQGLQHYSIAVQSAPWKAQCRHRPCRKWPKHTMTYIGRASLLQAFLLTILPSPRPGCYQRRFGPVPDTWLECWKLAFSKIRGSGGQPASFRHFSMQTWANCQRVALPGQLAEPLALQLAACTRAAACTMLLSCQSF